MLNVSDATKLAYKDFGESRQIEIKIYADTTITLTNNDIALNSVSVEEILESSDNLTFTGCNASIFKFKSVNRLENIKDKKIEATIKTGNTDTIPLFTGYIDSAKNTSFETVTMDIVAYDPLSKIKDLDFKSWYDTLFVNRQTPLTLKDFRDNFFTRVNIEQVATTLPNDDMTIEKTVEDNNIKGETILKWICQINGRYGRMTRDGKFEYVNLEGTGLYPSLTLYPSPYLYPNRTEVDNIEEALYVMDSIAFEKYEVQVIDSVQLADKDNHIIATAGSNIPLNIFTISGNPFIWGKSQQELNTIANNLFDTVNSCYYVPMKLDMVGLPYLECGDYVGVMVRNTVLRTVILHRILTGEQALMDNIEARGNEYQPAFIPNTDDKIQEAITKAKEETAKDITEYDVAVRRMNELAVRSLGAYNDYEDAETGGRIYYMSNMPITKDSQGKCHFDNNSIAYKIDGVGFYISRPVSQGSERIWENGYDAQTGELLINVLYAIGIHADWVVTGMLKDANYDPNNPYASNFWDLTNGNFCLRATTKIGSGSKTLDDLADKDEIIADVDVEYAKNQSSTTAPTTGWSTSSPQWEAGYYIWQRTKTTDGEGNISYSTPVCIQGAKGQDGLGINSTVIEYGVSNSASTQPSSWSTTAPTTIAEGKWLWVRTIYTYSDSSTKTVYTKSYIGTDGQDGTSISVVSATKVGKTTTVVLSDGTTLTIDDGDDGDQGVPGLNGYVHTAWALTIQGMDGASSTTGFSTSDSVNKKYLGTYTDNTAADSSDWHSYSWSRIKGDDGDDGVGVSAIVEQYYLSTSNQSPTGGSWSTNQPVWEEGKYIWTRSQVTWTDSTVTTTSPVLAKAINQANQSVKDLDNSLDQDGTFERLTDGGRVMGIFLDTDPTDPTKKLLFLNATYMKTGKIDAGLIKTGSLTADIIRDGTLIMGGTDDFNGKILVLGTNTNLSSSSSVVSAVQYLGYSQTNKLGKFAITANLTGLQEGIILEYEVYLTYDGSTFSKVDSGEITPGASSFIYTYPSVFDIDSTSGDRYYYMSIFDKDMTNRFNVSFSYAEITSILDENGITTTKLTASGNCKFGNLEIGKKTITPYGQPIEVSYVFGDGYKELFWNEWSTLSKNFNKIIYFSPYYDGWTDDVYVNTNAYCDDIYSSHQYTQICRIDLYKWNGTSWDSQGFRRFNFQSQELNNKDPWFTGFTKNDQSIYKITIKVNKQTWAENYVVDIYTDRQHTIEIDPYETTGSFRGNFSGAADFYALSVGDTTFNLDGSIVNSDDDTTASYNVQFEGFSSKISNTQYTNLLCDSQVVVEAKKSSSEYIRINTGNSGIDVHSSSTEYIDITGEHIRCQTSSSQYFRISNGSSNAPGIDVYNSSSNYINIRNYQVRIQSSSNNYAIFQGNLNPYAQRNGVDYYLNWTQGSDERIKEEIEPLNVELSKNLIDATETKKFKYKNTDGKHYGMIAQEARKLLDNLGEADAVLEYGPDIESDDIPDYRAIHYEEYIPHLINYVKDLQAQIDDLKEEIKILKGDK